MTSAAAVTPGMGAGQPAATPAFPAPAANTAPQDGGLFLSGASGATDALGGPGWLTVNIAPELAPLAAPNTLSFGGVAGGGATSTGFTTVFNITPDFVLNHLPVSPAVVAFMGGGALGALGGGGTPGAGGPGAFTIGADLGTAPVPTGAAPTPNATLSSITSMLSNGGAQNLNAASLTAMMSTISAMMGGAAAAPGGRPAPAPLVAAQPAPGLTAQPAAAPQPAVAPGAAAHTAAAHPH